MSHMEVSQNWGPFLILAFPEQRLHILWRFTTSNLVPTYTNQTFSKAVSQTLSRVSGKADFHSGILNLQVLRILGLWLMGSFMV